MGDQVRQHEEGRCRIWDESFEHEAENKAEISRLVLEVKIRHPRAPRPFIDVATSAAEERPAILQTPSGDASSTSPKSTLGKGRAHLTWQVGDSRVASQPENHWVKTLSESMSSWWKEL